MSRKTAYSPWSPTTVVKASVIALRTEAAGTTGESNDGRARPGER
jgi:hypothetical protein